MALCPVHVLLAILPRGRCHAPCHRPRRAGDLRHGVFEAVGIAVDYLDYHLSPYPRQHGGFEPDVTALDLLANAGPEARAHVSGRMVPWRDMVAHPAPAPADTR